MVLVYMMVCHIFFIVSEIKFRRRVLPREAARKSRPVFLRLLRASTTSGPCRIPCRFRDSVAGEVGEPEPFPVPPTDRSMGVISQQEVTDFAPHSSRFILICLPCSVAYLPFNLRVFTRCAFPQLFARPRAIPAGLAIQKRVERVSRIITLCTLGDSPPPLPPRAPG